MLSETGGAVAHRSAVCVETLVAFARSCPCGVETLVAFAGEKWVFFVRFSVAEVSPVSTVAVQGVRSGDGGFMLARVSGCRGVVGFKAATSLRPVLSPTRRRPCRRVWGFCSMRRWLAACRRRVRSLMMQFPASGDGRRARTLAGTPPAHGYECSSDRQ